MKKFILLGVVLSLVAAALFALDTIGLYLWTRVPTALILRNGQPITEIALYQRDGKLLVQDGLNYYLIGEEPGIVGVGSPSDFYQFHANYLHCRYPMPLVVEMNSSKVEIDPRLVVGDHRLEFTDLHYQRLLIKWNP